MSGWVGVGNEINRREWPSWPRGPSSFGSPFLDLKLWSVGPKFRTGNGDHRHLKTGSVNWGDRESKEQICIPPFLSWMNYSRITYNVLSADGSRCTFMSNRDTERRYVASLYNICKIDCRKSHVSIPRALLFPLETPHLYFCLNFASHPSNTPLRRLLDPP